MSQSEQHGYRNLHASYYHREYGSICDDLDMNIYNAKEIPVLHLELKHGNLPVIDCFNSEDGIIRFMNHAKLTGLPACIIFYYYEDESGRLVDDNEPVHLIKHRQYYRVDLRTGKCKMLSESDYVFWIASLSGMLPKPWKVFGREIKDRKRPTVRNLIGAADYMASPGFEISSEHLARSLDRSLGYS